MYIDLQTKDNLSASWFTILSLIDINLVIYLHSLVTTPNTSQHQAGLMLVQCRKLQANIDIQLQLFKVLVEAAVLYGFVKVM